MSNPMIFEKMTTSIIDGQIQTATDLLKQAMTDGIPANACVQKGFKPGLDEIGRGFEAGDYFIPDLILAGKVMQSVVESLQADSNEELEKKKIVGSVIMATVKGDLHTIGKQLVIMMLSMNGFAVTDLGIDVPSEVIVEKVKQERPDIIGLSSLLSTTTAYQKEVIEALEKEGIRDSVKVLVGGAVVSKEWAMQIGADGYAEDANSAVIVAKEVLGIP